MTDQLPTTQEQSGNALAKADGQAALMLASVISASRDPSVDCNKMVAMANLAMQLQDRERESAFNQAKMAAIMEMPAISKRGSILNKSGGVQSRYSKYEDIHKAVMPILHKHGLAISFNVGNAGQMVTVQPILSHASGYTEKGEAMALPIDTTGSKNGTQGAGSAASYGKRHTIKAMLNIIEAGEDDDGQRAGGSPLDRLNTQERELVALGNAAAQKGAQAYAEWFGSLSPAERGWLAYNGRHDELKQASGA
ncbi:MAG: ERF family protein [Ahrensia sp.]|nr:ERF family protein [Ahrensia sp.]